MGLISGWRAMRRALILVGLSLLVSGMAMAGTPLSSGETDYRTTVPAEEGPTFFSGIFNQLETEFILTAGLRRDQLDWSVAGNPSGSDPNILSELSWSGVDSYQLSLSNRSRYKRHIYLRGHLNYAWIRDGRVRDSDYGEDDRAAEYSRSMSETNRRRLVGSVRGRGVCFLFHGGPVDCGPHDRIFL